MDWVHRSVIGYSSWVGEQEACWLECPICHTSHPDDSYYLKPFACLNCGFVQHVCHECGDGEAETRVYRTTAIDSGRSFRLQLCKECAEELPSYGYTVEPVGEVHAGL